MLTTTLNEIRSHSPRDIMWKKLLSHLGKTKADDEPLPVVTVLDSNGPDNALWVLDYCCDPYIRRLLAADFAESVLHIFELERPNDTRPRDAIATARNPNATEEELDAACIAACIAAWDAGNAGAVWAALAAEDAARSAARSAAWSAANAAAAEVEWAALSATAAAQPDARASVRPAQEQRLRQYLEHGVAARDMPW